MNQSRTHLISHAQPPTRDNMIIKQTSNIAVLFRTSYLTILFITTISVSILYSVEQSVELWKQYHLDYATDF
jgi:hypothetical protein